MLFTGLGHRRFAGSVLLSLLLPFVMQDSTAQVVRQVLTPFGYRDADQVHTVPQGYELAVMPDGHIRMENPTTGDHTDFPKPAAANADRVPFTDNGWITFASWYNQYTTPIAYFHTYWSVPPEPATYNGQTLFQFNSIEPASGDAILQPVLQYGVSAAGGGQYWAIASWYVTGNQGYVSSLNYVTPGTFLDGEIGLLARRKNHFSYTCEFYNYSTTILTVRRIPQLVWATETLEVYGVNECTDFPKTAYSQMGSIYMVLNNGYIPTVGWTVTDAATSCGVQTTIVVNGANNGAVNIYY
jgi:hypothetical protein